MKRSVALLTAGMFAAAACVPAFAQNRADTELNQATNIMHDLTGPQAQGGIPDSVLRNAKCVAVIPKMVKAGFVVGGQHGAGVATCRLSDGRWSPPAPFDLSGASFGLQIGGEVEGYVMMIMNHEGMAALNSGHFKVGAGLNAAAGPVGREGDASAGNNAAILVYAKAKGIYGGATLNGAELNQDHGETRDLYGHEVPFSSILDGQVHMPDAGAAHAFVQTINHDVNRAAR
ncbi:MAG TPA: lipid-binding SYLF domain-containing protein [Acidobacteriaceae bacterium]|jgi:lipid-binding SYLF domain-containing protein|nr:lipid-binding SYLF domain-containing protein [Acidobacteriaceae bacterium]